MRNFIIILLTGLASSLVPFLHIGLIFGLPSVILNTALICFIFKEELFKPKLAESQIDDLKQQMDKLYRAVYQENRED